MRFPWKNVPVNGAAGPEFLRPGLLRFLCPCFRQLRARGCPETGQGHRPTSSMALRPGVRATTAHCSLFTVTLGVTGRQLCYEKLLLTQFGQKSTWLQETIKTGFMKKSRFPVWKVCSEWWLNTFMESALHTGTLIYTHAMSNLLYRNHHLTDRFACSSDFTSITFTVNTSVLFSLTLCNQELAICL